MRPIILAALALTGCASTQTVLNREPFEVVRSAKSADEVTFCLQNKMGVPALDKDGAKVVLSKTTIGVVGEAFTIRPDGTGSIIELRKGSTLLHGYLRRCYPPRP
jgi:hypothetical protein